MTTDNATIEIIEGEFVDDSVVRETALALISNTIETPIQAVARSLATYKAINTLIDQTFKEGVHYGSIPGVDKKILMLPGIESTMSLLSLHEKFVDVEVVRNYEPDNPFFYYEMECHLFTIGTNVEVARGVGVCHSREKIFMRSDQRTCPDCGSASIMRSKYPPRDKPNMPKGWYCNAKSGGCGNNFLHNDVRITEQSTGNAFDAQLVWDSVNSIRKKAKKRALADAVKRIGMLSEKFTVDLDDDPTFSEQEMRQSPVSESTGNRAGSNPPQKIAPKWYEENNGANLKTIVDWARGKGMVEETDHTKASAELLKLANVESWDKFDSGKTAWATLTTEHEKQLAELNNRNADKSQSAEPAQDEPEAPADKPASNGAPETLSDKDRDELKKWIVANFAGRDMASVSEELNTDFSEFASIGAAKAHLIKKAEADCWAVVTNMLTHKKQGKSSYLLFHSPISEIRHYSRTELVKMLGDEFPNVDKIKILPEGESLMLDSNIVVSYEAKGHYNNVVSAVPLEQFIPF